MGAVSSSSKAYMGNQYEEEDKKGEDKDSELTNVIAIKSGNAFSTTDLATGDPTRCSSCSAMLNKYSVLTPKLDEKSAYSWICEFCGEINTVKIDVEEIPKLDTATYIIEKTKPVIDAKKQDDITVVFCIDISGSMDVTTPTSTMSKYNKYKGYVSRLECLKLAIDQQLLDMVKNSQNIKTGFITFEQRVHILGDGSRPEFVLNESCYGNYESMIECSLSKTDYISLPIVKSQPFLMTKLKDMETGGSTALGPALLASIAMASAGKPGSKVILCTDGMANIGIGSVESTKHADESGKFYEKIGAFAKEKGVLISLVSLVEKECRLELLSPVANLTGGNIVRVDPTKLESQFKEFMNEAVVATNVQVSVRVHKAMQFSNEASGIIKGSEMIREIGNATANTEMTFEYKIRSLDEVKKIPNFDVNTIKAIPVQACINYKTIDGMKMMKVLNMQIPVTFQKDDYMKGIKKEVIQAHMQQQAAQYIDMQNYGDASKNLKRWNQVVKEEEKPQDLLMLEDALGEQEVLEQKATVKNARFNMKDKLAEAVNKNRKAFH